MPFLKTDGEQKQCEWADWKSFLIVRFKPVQNIRKYHHFCFTKEDQGCFFLLEPGLYNNGNGPIRKIFYVLGSSQCRTPESTSISALIKRIQDFLSARFKPVLNIRKYHHFHFTKEDPGFFLLEPGLNNNGNGPIRKIFYVLGSSPCRISESTSIPP